MRTRNGTPLLLVLATLATSSCAGDRFYLFDRDADGVPVGADCDDLDPSVGMAYADVDGDGHGAGSPTADCDDLGGDGYITIADDCDDADSSTYPGADEQCDGRDNDCDGEIDEGVPETEYYADSDGDRYGDPEDTVMACAPPDGYANVPTDCDDSDPSIHPGVDETCDGVDNDCDGEVDEGLLSTYYFDGDEDSFGDPNTSTDSCDPAEGWVEDNTDCNDDDPSIYPGSPEACDGLDDDCDGVIDNGLEQNPFYYDADGDSYGDPDNVIEACEKPQGTVGDDTDCDDTNPDIHPGATEECNEVDDDCDGEVDEDGDITFYLDADGDNFGLSDTTTVGCMPPDGYAAEDGDCDDNDPSTYPGAPEQCDEIDNDCDGEVDNDSQRTTFYKDADGDGYGNPDITKVDCKQPADYVLDDTDCNDADASAYPGADEVCDGVDNDCNGDVDEGLEFDTYYADVDEDGHGDPDVALDACKQPDGYVDNNTDCNDQEPAAYDGAEEVCDGVDNDCNGSTDEGLPDDDHNGIADTCENDVDQDGFLFSEDCNDSDASVYPGAQETIGDDIDSNCNGYKDIITTVAGNGYYSYYGDEGPAVEAQLNFPNGLAVDVSGNIFIADTTNNRIRMVDAAGVIHLVAGNGRQSYSGDGGPAIDAGLNRPWGILVDGDGRILFADSQNYAVRMIDQDGILSTIAGVPLVSDSGRDGYSATSTPLMLPYAVALDQQGRLLIADYSDHRVRIVLEDNTMGTVAGTGEAGDDGDGGLATEARLRGPSGLAVDSEGNVYISDAYSHRVRKVDTDGKIWTVAGNGTTEGPDSGNATEARLRGPWGLDVGPDGALYIADDSTVKRLTIEGTMTVVAGGGDTWTEGAAATEVRLSGVHDVAVSPDGTSFYFTYYKMVISVGPDGIIATVAGVWQGGYSGDEGPATEAQIMGGGMTVDSEGQLFLADTENGRVRMVDVEGVIHTVAGTGQWSCSGNYGPATEATMESPKDVALDAEGNLYIADSGCCQVRMVDREGVIAPVAGSGCCSTILNDIPATQACVQNPSALAIGNDGALYIAQASYGLVRKVKDGIITTVAGTGESGCSGDGGPATEAQVGPSKGIAFDSAGNLYIPDSSCRAIRKIDTEGTITTIAGSGTITQSDYVGPATDLQFYDMGDVAVDQFGNIFFADPSRHEVWLLDSEGIIRPVAGNQTYNTADSPSTPICPVDVDGRAATDVCLWSPTYLAVDNDGNLLIDERNTDHDALHIRLVRW